MEEWDSTGKMAWGSWAFSGVTLGDSCFTVSVLKERGSATQECAEPSVHGNSPQTWAFLGRRSLLPLHPSWPFLLREGEALTYLIPHHSLQNPLRTQIPTGDRTCPLPGCTAVCAFLPEPVLSLSGCHLPASPRTTCQLATLYPVLPT